MIYVIATLNIKPGKRDDVIAASGPVLEGTRAEPGCIRYELNATTDNPDQLVFVEEWKSPEDLELHGGREHIKVWRDAVLPHLVDRKVEIIYPEKVVTR